MAREKRVYILEDFVDAYRKITADVGAHPKYNQFIDKAPGLGLPNTKFNMTVLGISFNDIKYAAGQPVSTPQRLADQAKAEKKYVKLCSKREQIEGFHRHVIDLKELFERAGNPPTLKLSAQPDTHGKFKDHAAWTCYIKFLEYWKPDVHLIMGDYADCEGLSHWPSDDLEPRRIVPEAKIIRQMLETTVQATPKCTTRLYLEGNHERWIQMALGKMPELFDGLTELDIEISVKTLFALERYGYQMFPLNELIQIGKAHFTHGIYTGSYHAAKHLHEYKANIYYGHLHDLQEHNNTSIDGPLEAASLGCLCRLDAKFLKGKKNNWAHAHGCFEFFPDGTYTFYRPRILNGVMAYNGMIFRGNSEPLPCP